MASPHRLCETFLKLAWPRVAPVFAALIALSGGPVTDADARQAGHAPTPAAAPAQPPPQGPAVERPAQPTAPDAHAAPATTAPAAGQAGPGAEPAAAQQPAGHAAAPVAGAAAAHGGAAAPAADAHGQPQAHGPPAAGGHGEAAGHGGSGGHAAGGIKSTIYRLINFALLAGGLYYFLRKPLSDYLAGRDRQIRGGLVSARETSERATAQLAELDRRLQALPVELAALKAKGVEEIATEERRIQAQAEAERKRLIDDMQRDVDVRVRVARKALAEEAADLAVGLAADRVRQTITDAEQARLIDRYAAQVKDIHV
jgi:F-type H+-transporting ATPase subunit b